MLGTIINVVAVLVGGATGALLGNRLPEKIQQTVVHGLGLITAVVGLQMALQSRNQLIVMASILLGGIIGEWLNIEAALEAIGRRLEQRFTPVDAPASAKPLSRAFVTASLVFCVGPLAVVGSILDGLTGNYQPLALKSMMDGFASLAFGASMGPGVLLSALSLLVYQGGLSLGAHFFGGGLSGVTADAPGIIEMTATGGVLIMGISLLLLDLKRIRVGNFLPALLIAPGLVALLQALRLSF